MSVCEYESELEGVLESHYLNLRDIDEEQANEFEKAWHNCLVISGSLEVMLMKLLEQYFEHMQENLCRNDCNTKKCHKDCTSGYQHFSKVNELLVIAEKIRVLEEKKKKCLS